MRFIAGFAEKAGRFAATQSCLNAEVLVKTGTSASKISLLFSLAPVQALPSENFASAG